MKKVAKAVPALLSVGFAVVLYLLARIGRWPLAALLLIGVLAIGTAFRVVGIQIARRNPTRAAWIIDGWILGVLAVGAAVTLGTILLATWAEEKLKIKDNALAEATGALAGTAITSAASVLFTKDLEDAKGEVWPSSVFRRAIEESFGTTPPYNTRGTVQYEAVWEERMTGDNNHVKGWGFRARRSRAKLLK
jgi:hypothetical protein